MTVTVDDCIKFMATLAPPSLAESWDNVGLQIGSRKGEVNHIVVALDPSPRVVDHACDVGADLLITHHPVMLSPIRILDIDSPVGHVIRSAVSGRLSIFSAHTNLDSASGGINDQLASRMGLTGVVPLLPAVAEQTVRLELMLPTGLTRHDIQKAVGSALWPSDASDSGACETVTGICSPDAQGFQAGRLVSLVLKRDKVDGVLKRFVESMGNTAFFHEVRPITAAASTEGLGRFGNLHEPMALAPFIDHLKQCLGLTRMRQIGVDPSGIRRIMVCSGSGGSLLESFFASDADVFVTGDIRYHDARRIEDVGRCVIDIGHFESEHLVVEWLAERLSAYFNGEAHAVTVMASPVEADPFKIW